MTGNKIVLYKAPWNFSTLYQPYFMSDAARDSYFSKLPLIDIIGKGNINIHFDYNLEAELVIPIDYSIAIDYNFCMIIYNGRKFYSSILDYCQSSVGYTKIQIRRHIISEKTNFFQYFKDFRISELTLPEDKREYGKTARLNIPTMRCTYRQVFPKLKLQTRDINLNSIEYSCDYMLCYILFLDRNNIPSINPDYTPTNLYGDNTQYVMAIIPFSRNTYPLTDGIYYRTSLYYNESSSINKKVEYYATPSPSVILNKLSPYIKSMYLSYIPVFKSDDLEVNTYKLPYFWNKAEYKISDTENVNIIYLYRTYPSGASNFDINQIDDYYSFSFSITDKERFLNIHINPYTRDQQITIPIYWKKRTAGVITGKIEIIYNIQGTNMQIRLNGDNNSLYSGNTIDPYNVELGDNTSYLVDANYNFDAQNRYYNAMTRSLISQRGAQGAVKAGAEFSLGGLQIATGAMMPSAGGKIANMSMGVGNVIRGLQTIGETAIDSHYMKEQRNISRMNEKAKPDALVGGSNAIIRMKEFDCRFNVVIETAFDEDYNDFVHSLEVDGVSVDMFSETFNPNDYAINGNFYISAIADINTTSSLSSIEYSEMYILLKTGCRYFIVE